ncbi:MAG: hypothetical protein GY714_23490 [Desulfobacterales bacterium]|nr:hypothetical protein [Desulfobacterales bacterium]
MATLLTEIYPKITSILSDTDYSKLIESEVENILNKFIDKSASLDFKHCKKDLSDRTSIQFNQSLDNEEQWIIAYGSVLAWLDQHIYKTRIIRVNVSTNNSKEGSHANQLKELRQLKKDTKREMQQYVVNYTFNGFQGFDSV